MWIEHKFELQTGVAEMTRRKIAIHSRNVVGYLEFLMKYPDLWHNQTFELSCVYNENEEQVYKEMYTSKSWWKQQKEHPPQVTIIPILISNVKTVISVSHRDQIFWPVLITIRNLDAKIW